MVNLNDIINFDASSNIAATIVCMVTKVMFCQHNTQSALRAKGVKRWAGL
jgi:hypothetical protein